MKNKAILVSLVAFFAIVLTLNAVMASVVDDGFVTIENVKVNGISVDGYTSIGHVSNTVLVEVFFTAHADVEEDVNVRVYVEGYRSEISESVTLRTPLEEGVGDVVRFSLKLPSSIDLDDLSEDLSLVVRFSAQGEDSVEKDYTMRMKKDTHSLNLLSVEAPDKVIAGSTVAIDVVVKNDGYKELEDIYVKASIPDLGIERRVYLGDLDERDERDFDSVRSIDRHDTTSKKIYLTIPRNSIPGIYNVEVEAYNYDTSVTAKKRVVVDSIETGILPTVTTKAISVGEETTFDVVLINPNDRMVVYSITPEESMGLTITVTEPIVTVPADSSRTVKVNVKATDSAEEGTHLVTVNVNSESGLEKQITFSVNVEGKKSGFSGTSGNSVVILTVILVIIFVVLLIILIVLLTKRPAEPEEFGETSYY